MEETLSILFENNKQWVNQITKLDKDYFGNLAKGQHPDILYIGCSDSRVPVEDMLGLQPGQAFVHRNIANLVNGTDLNAMAVINYAVVHLKVKHIIVCGHYGCGGVAAAMQQADLGILNPWLRSIRDVHRFYKTEMDSIHDEKLKYKRLIELNVLEQCVNVIKAAEVQLRYVNEGFPKVHGWIFDNTTGLIHDLGIDFKKVLSRIQHVYDLTNQKWF
jgi:carbonic anhydrase